MKESQSDGRAMLSYPAPSGLADRSYCQAGSEGVSLFLDYTVEEQPSELLLIQELESCRPKPLVFVLNANLLAMVKLVNCTWPSFFYM